MTYQWYVIIITMNQNYGFLGSSQESSMEHLFVSREHDFNHASDCRGMFKS